MLATNRKKEISAILMETIDKPTAHLLAGLLKARGVRHIVVSPGSRCAPLTVVFARSGHFELHPVIDERTAAFVALGMSLATDTPVVALCTSGSALLNYAPALSEAYYRRVPVIAVTADRPAAMIDQRDSQTVRQPHALDAVVRKCVDIPDEHSETALQMASRLINDALIAATGHIPGPVHINMQFEMPLTPETPVAPAISCRSICVHRSAPACDFAPVIESIPAGCNVLVALGGMHVGSDEAALLRSLPLAVYAEAQSNVAIPNYGIDNFAGLPPVDVLVTAGGAIISDSFKRWLRQTPSLRHISLGFDDNCIDTYGALTDIVECRPTDFLKALAQAGVSSPAFIGSWRNALDAFKARDARNTVWELIETLAHNVGPEAVVHVSNGMAARYAQKVDFLPGQRIEMNRGVSGIEGATSTAVGDAIVNGRRPTLLISGDMSAAYDISALSIEWLPDNFRMVVLDNDGGDIFRTVRTTAQLPERERFFTMPPKLPLSELAAAYGLKYFTSPDEFMKCGTKSLLHVKVTQGKLD